MSQEHRRQIWMRCETCERRSSPYQAWIDEDQLDQGEWAPVMDGTQLRVRYYTWDMDQAKVVGGYRQVFEDVTAADAGERTD